MVIPETESKARETETRDTESQAAVQTDTKDPLQTGENAAAVPEESTSQSQTRDEAETLPDGTIHDIPEVSGDVYVFRRYRFWHLLL